MTAEHKPTDVKGYRALSSEEIELINLIKADGASLHKRIKEVRDLLTAQACENSDVVTQRHHNAEPNRWLAEARTDLQKGLMSLVRAVAQPSGF
jgi:hypothetical protein